MTEKQRDQELKALRIARENGLYPVEELNRRSEIFDCIEMIDSIICYHCFGKTAEEIIEYEKKQRHNYLEDYIKRFGEDMVKQLIEGQIKSIHHIEKNSFEDDEGLIYNSIVYVDEV